MAHPIPSGQLVCFCIFYSLYYKNKLFLTISIQTNHVSRSAALLTATGWRWVAMLHKRQTNLVMLEHDLCSWIAGI
jgi:hypothetical protein